MPHMLKISGYIIIYSAYVNDYFKGNIDLSLDEVGGVIIDFLNNMRK